MRYLAGVLVVGSLFISLPSFAAKDPNLDSWDNAIGEGALRELDRFGNRLSEMLFDAIDDINIYSASGAHYGANLSIHRKVFDNNDILNSWTVVDRFNIDGSFPIYSTSSGDAATGGLFSFWIGAKTGLEFMNIRQVMPRDYPSFPSPKERKQEIQSQAWFQEFKQLRDEPPPAEGQWVETGATDSNGFSTQDNSQDGTADSTAPTKNKFSFVLKNPQENARYSRLWDRISFPFRLPLKAKDLKELEDGEIISYLGSGSVEVGASVGWNLDPSGISGIANAGISYSTYVNGMYRVSILKETDRFAKVKLTRSMGIGHGANFGADYKPTVLDGIIIVKNIQRIGKVVPFRLSITQSASRAFDVGYRFDMEMPAARQAYERAAMGRFALADELAINPDGTPRDFKETGVEKQFTRRTDASSRATSSGLKLGFIFKNDASNNVTDANATITLPDGTHHIFTSTADNKDSWRTFWGTFERSMHRFIVNLDLDKYVKGASDDSFNLKVEAKIEDSDVGEAEMLRYILEVEDSIGKPNIFPRHKDVGTVGRTSFYFQLGLNNQQLQKFIDYPEENMWPALEKAFGVKPEAWSSAMSRISYAFTHSLAFFLNVPLYAAGYHIHKGSDLLAARRIYARWSKLKEITEPKERAETLGHIFLEKFYGYELTRLIRAVFTGETVSYYVVGDAPTFGRVVDQGGSQLNFENIATRAERLIDFDRQAGRTQNTGAESGISDYEVTVLDQNRIQLDFTLKKAPAALFFQARIDNWWTIFGKEPIFKHVPNTGQFKEGKNTIVIDKSDPQSPWFDVSKFFELNNIYAINLAVNVDGQNWGPVASKKFRFRPLRVRPAEAKRMTPEFDPDLALAQAQ